MVAAWHGQFVQFVVRSRSVDLAVDGNSVTGSNHLLLIIVRIFFPSLKLFKSCALLIVKLKTVVNDV